MAWCLGGDPTARARSFSEGNSLSGGSLQSAQSARPGAGGSAARKVGLAAVAFGAVALAAEDLEVLKGARAALGMWHDVVHVQRAILTGDAAQGTATATGFEHLEPHRPPAGESSHLWFQMPSPRLAT